MKISDLLRNLANQMDDKEKPVPLSMAGSSANSSDADSKTATDDTTTMVPPLQQHLELLKKKSGLDNAFDGESDGPDDLAQLKKMAGISQFANRTVGDPNENN